MVSTVAPQATSRVSSRRTLTLPPRLRFLGPWLAPMVVGIVALAIDLYHLGNASLWTDEGFSFWQAYQPPAAIWNTFHSGEVDMVLYYSILSVWVHVTGAFGAYFSEFFLRLPATFIGAVSAAGVYVLARRFLGQLTAITAAAVFILNDFQISGAQETRTYTLQLLLLVVSWGCFWTLIMRDSRRRWWVVLVLANVLLCYAHALSVLSIVTQGIAFGLLLVLPTAFRARARELFWPLVVSFVVTIIAVAPIAIASRGNADLGWLPVPAPRDVVHAYMTLAINGSRAVVVFVAVLALAVAAALIRRWTLVRARVRAGTEGDTSTATSTATAASVPAIAETLPGAANERLVVIGSLILWAVVPVVLSYLLSLTGPTHRYFSDYHLRMIIPPLAILLGVVVASIPWRPAGVLAAVALIAIMIATVPPTFDTYAWPQEDWRTGTQWLLHHDQPSDGMLCFAYKTATCDEPIFHYYIGYRGGPDAATMLSQSLPDATNPSAVAAYVAQHPRVFYVYGSPGDAATVANARATQAWLDAHYTLIGQYSGWITVRLYSTTTTPSSGP